MTMVNSGLKGLKDLLENKKTLLSLSFINNISPLLTLLTCCNKEITWSVPNNNIHSHIAL